MANGRLVAGGGGGFTALIVLANGGLEWGWKLTRWALEAIGWFGTPDDARRAREMLAGNPDWPVIAATAVAALCLAYAIRPQLFRPIARGRGEPVPVSDWPISSLLAHLNEAVGEEAAEIEFKDAAANERLHVWGREFDTSGMTEFVGSRYALGPIPPAYWLKASLDVAASVPDEDYRYRAPHTGPMFQVRSLQPIYCDLMVNEREAKALWPRKRRKAEAPTLPDREIPVLEAAREIYNRSDTAMRRQLNDVAKLAGTFRYEDGLDGVCVTRLQKAARAGVTQILARRRAGYDLEPVPAEGLEHTFLRTDNTISESLRGEAVWVDAHTPAAKLDKVMEHVRAQLKI